MKIIFKYIKEWLIIGRYEWDTNVRNMLLCYCDTNYASDFSRKNLIIMMYF